MKKLQKAYYTKINFIDDIFENEKYLLKSILDKKILVIGGAGTIGSNYVKEILKFKPSRL